MPRISGLRARLPCVSAPETASGNALGLGQHVQLAALPAAIDRVRPGQRIPLFARTAAASTIADVQSSSPRAPSPSKTTRCGAPPQPRLGPRGEPPMRRRR
jgi:hypothetical protein